MRTIKVNLDARSYPIHMGEGLLGQTGELMHRAGCTGKVGIVTNPVVGKLYLKTVEESLSRSGFGVSSILIRDGEEHKNMTSLASIYDHLVRERFERCSSLVALGGGVVGDLTGFAAATFLRGIAYVQIPTTLLAQVDSSVGGKTGVNHPEGKNLIGAFYQPKVVVIDLAVLRSLPRRELAAGLAEVIKYGIIQDADLFAYLEKNLSNLWEFDRTSLERIVADSCRIKAAVVEKDEREEDYRAILNFGHTLGHALESEMHYEDLLHGEAVAIGMAKAAKISFGEGLCNRESLERIVRLIQQAGLPTDLPRHIKLEQLIKTMELDKKSSGGKIKFVICKGIGAVQFQRLSAEEVIARLAD